MSQFSYLNGSLHAEQVPLTDIAEQIGTPCYVYSRAALEHQWNTLDQAFGDHEHLICYAVKANSNLAVLNVLARLGSGFDIVSAGELRRVIMAGGDPAKVVLSGVAKSRAELEYVIENQIRCINVESIAELERIEEVAAAAGTTAKIALRVNPDVDAQTHPYIATGLEQSKFGVPMQDALATYQRAEELQHIEIFSIACHIGSQITNLAPYKDAVNRVLELVSQLSDIGISIQQLDLGGGLGIDYQGESPPTAEAYVNTLIDTTRASGINLPIAIEPGRYIAGNAGVLLTTVEYLKHNSSKNFAVVDAGMNDLLRPSLYHAYHEIVNVKEHPENKPSVYDVVGPVCESADVLGYDRHLSVQADDLLAVMSTGAYAFAMASNYNSRVRPPEIMVDGNDMHIVRRRETLEELMQAEAVLP
ncbi:MAG: diaminopimelate decarboxylase [Pseudomonadota bacterium]